MGKGSNRELRLYNVVILLAYMSLELPDSIRETTASESPHFLSPLQHLVLKC